MRYGIVRVSFGRRIELARRIREIGRKVEYLEAASDVREKLEATVLAAEIDRAYLEWGLDGVEGLEIDGAAATPAMLIERGPVELAMEILARIKSRMRVDGRRTKKLMVAFHFSAEDVVQPGRVEMRRMQTAGAGSEAAMRVASGGTAGSAEAGVGARARRRRRSVPKSLVTPQSVEMDGEVLRVEVCGRRGAGRIAGERCGCVSDSGKRVAGWNQANGQ